MNKTEELIGIFGVLCDYMVDNGRCAVAYYCYDDEDGNCWVTDDEKTIYDLEEVTRWQPLPEPPKGGDTND